MTKISIIISSRVSDNPNHGLLGLLESLRIQTLQPSEIEVLVKFDYDDVLADDVIRQIKSTHYPFYVQHCRGERNRGYIDIHGGYNQLLAYITRSTQIVIAMADDFTVEHGWDQELIRRMSGEYFIIHQRPHPITLEEYQQRENNGSLDNRPQFNLSNDPFENGGNLFIMDEYPAWSKKLLDAIIDFPVSFTDAWTLCLEHMLWHHYGVSITQFTERQVIGRKVCDEDNFGSNRWANERKENFEFINSNHFKSIVQQQAMRVYSNLPKKQEVLA